MICIQESKLKPDQKPPELSEYAVECESRDRLGGGVLTYIKETRKFSRLTTLEQRDEAQMIKIKLHVQPKKSITISNLYITPKELPVDQDDAIVTQYIQEAMQDNAIVLADANAHSESWYEHDETDHRGNTIEQIIEQSDSIIACKMPILKRKIKGTILFQYSPVPNIRPWSLNFLEV